MSIGWESVRATFRRFHYYCGYQRHTGITFAKSYLEDRDVNTRPCHSSTTLDVKREIQGLRLYSWKNWFINRKFSNKINKYFLNKVSICTSACFFNHYSKYALKKPCLWTRTCKTFLHLRLNSSWWPIYVTTARNNHTCKYRTCRMSIVASAVCHVAPSCWNFMSFNLGQTNRLSSLYNARRSRWWLSQKFWPMTQPAQPNSNFWRCIATWWTSWGLASPHVQQFRVLTFIQKRASSLKLGSFPNAKKPS